MILRIKKPDGSTIRGSGSGLDSLLSLLLDSQVVSDEDITLGAIKAYKDPKGQAEEMIMEKKISDLGLSNGDFVYLKSKAPKVQNDTEMNGDVARAATESMKESVSGSAPESSSSKKKAKCKFHGPQMVCTSCTVSETKEDRLKQALKDVWTDGGMSMAVSSALEAFRFIIKRQEEGRTKVAVVDNEAAFEFQSYLSKIQFQQQRCGVLYGTIEKEETNVLAIYEPPQEGTDKVYSIQTNPGALQLSRRAASLSRQLGLLPVGLIFSHRTRNAVLSGYDIVSAAKLQVEFLDEVGESDADAFIILTVSPSEDGSIHFNSYQLSNQCIEMYRRGVFAPAEMQRRNSGKVKTHPEGWVLYQDKDRTFTHDKVLVENAETDSIPTEFFLINVAIKSHKSWLRTKFPVENREIAPQLIEDVAKNLNSSEEPRFVRRISDFHLLNFLSGFMDLSGELPGLIDIVREQRDPTAQESGYQIILEALVS
ncbi:hypothetical protein NDN08_007803 [Rhodosorus marinus]|uniref:MPN domain-containing protein n=1 Tax=Rhodosorus marinus TaxID=101924 RepID=A0AAV8V1E4_9RHOD|nr:hypothetical protein NDN08_007803 [Rhodosorus marinus]